MGGAGVHPEGDALAAAIHAGIVIGADWPAPPGIRVATTLRHGAGVSDAPYDRFNLGARCGDDPVAVTRNRAALQVHLGLPAPPRWLSQVHGTRVVRFGVGGVLPGETAAEDAGGTDIAAEPEADAARTDSAGVVLAILTADCLPVILAAHDGSEVAAAHAGWRGLAAGMLETTVAAMQVDPSRLRAWLGPAAGPAAYEVGGDVHAAFVDYDPAAATAFAATRPGHWRVDLYALARRRLAAAGVDPAHIHGGNRCTISEPGAFFSHRRDGHGGRIATLAWRTER